MSDPVTDFATQMQTIISKIETATNQIDETLTDPEDEVDSLLNDLDSAVEEAKDLISTIIPSSDTGEEKDEDKSE